MPEVSLIATLVGTVLSFVLGAVWYGPLFANAWMAENGFTKEQLDKDFNPAKTFGSTFVLSLIGAYVFGILIGPDRGVFKATLAGLGVGLGLVSTSLATSYLFERKSMRHFLINGGYDTVRFTLIGLAFGLLG